MPYPNLPDDPELIEKMDECVEDVMADGNDKESAIAICHDSVVGDKGMTLWQSKDVQVSVLTKALGDL